MNFVDTHCHLFQEYYDNISLVLHDATSCGVKQFIVSGCDEGANREIIDLMNQYPAIYGVLGIHPEEANHDNVDALKFIEGNLFLSKILGIGEIGLDYHYTKETKQEQIALFEKQLSLAEKYNLPVVIHSRDATEDTINILKKYKVKGVIHSFSGSLETARIYIKMGYYLGINGVVTFKNSKLKEILPEILQYIVLETDSPYLTPHPYRGIQNSPKYILEIAKFIAEELNIPLSQVEKVTNENILRVFDKMSSL